MQWVGLRGPAAGERPGGEPYSTIRILSGIENDDRLQREE